jgi:formylglycine-generating enzyme required for sulfatase activity
MKTWKRAIATIIVCGIIFTGCKDGSDSNDASPSASVPPTVAVTGVTLSGDANFRMVAGQNKVLVHTVQPANATNQNVAWSSSNTDAAIVSEGVVYAIGAGTAIITVTTRSGDKKATCIVTVTGGTGGIAITGLELDETVLFLVVGSSQLLTPTVYPENASNSAVTWFSYNTNVATAINGTVLGVGAGKTTIVASTADGVFEAVCAVTVANTIPTATGMVWIKPGTFMMGSPYDEPESYDNEILHQVTLTEGFLMGKYPVTQAEFFAVTGYNDSYFPNEWQTLYASRSGEFPVENVNWFEAIRYCNVRSIREGLSPAYIMYKSGAPNALFSPDRWVDEPENWTSDPAEWGSPPFDSGTLGIARWNHVRMVAGSSGYRLPTEAQWEYACRAGTTTPFNTGNNITTDQANYHGFFPYNGNPAGVLLSQTIPAGMYPANAWGLYDMHGNVFEWCWDFGGSYTRDVTTYTDIDPTGPDYTPERTLRGGSFYNEGGYLRSAFRMINDPTLYHIQIGFRVIRPYSAPGASSKSRAKAVEETPSYMMREGKTLRQDTWSFDNTDGTSPSPLRTQATLREAVIKE